MNGKGCKWMKVRLVTSLLLVSISMVPGKMDQPVAAKAISKEEQVNQIANLNNPQSVSAPDLKVEAELLERTVQIKVYALLPAAKLVSKQPGYKHSEYLVTSGLGSLVVWQGKYVVVTHNHWGEVLNQAEYVQILDWQGKLLRTMEVKKLMSLVVYSDPGTMVLYDPTATWVSAGHLGEEQSVDIGDLVAIVHQDPIHPDKVALMQAKVVGHHQNNNLSVIGVAIMDHGTIVAGDSGGGVWLDGELIGNTWAVENSSDQTVSSDSGLIAQLPKISIENQDDAAETPDTPIYISSDPIIW